ncbi:CAP domain-containing protein [Mucilaginibacter gracilis]|nr:CAP domain-containing protein [Mucilaginibacter gracilis]
MKPVSPLTWNDLLAQSATEHAKDMYKHNYFNHESKDGSTSEDRIIKAGYIYKGYQKYTTGENIAYGQQSILEVLANWFKSDGHCKNIMNPDFKEIGVAEYNYYWVQDFGGRVSFAAH